MSALDLNTTYGVIIHRDFIPLYVDENYARIFGYDSAQHLLNSIDTLLDLISPEFHEIAIKTSKNLIAGKVEAKTRTHSNINAKGERFSVLTLDHVVEWECEPALQVTVVDMTLIEKANQKIRDNERQYRELITTSKQGIMIHRNFKPLLVNDAWVESYKADSIESVMQVDSLLQLIPESNRELAMTRNTQLLNGEIEGGSVLVENFCFDGSVRSFNLYDNKIIWDGEPAVQTVSEDVTEKVQLQKELAYKASHDQLTDLYNREAIFDWFDSQTDPLESLACLLVDIDNFKYVNDTYGHYAGDKVIKSFAFLCESEVGEKGIVGRWGGEEFLVLLPNISLEQSVALAERIRENFHERPCRYGSNYIRTSVSIGVSFIEKAIKRKQLDKLLKIADDNMYQAKHLGKNQVIC